MFKQTNDGISKIEAIALSISEAEKKLETLQDARTAIFAEILEAEDDGKSATSQKKKLSETDAEIELTKQKVKRNTEKIKAVADAYCIQRKQALPGLIEATKKNQADSMGVFKKLLGEAFTAGLNAGIPPAKLKKISQPFKAPYGKQAAGEDYHIRSAIGSALNTANDNYENTTGCILRQLEMEQRQIVDPAHANSIVTKILNKYRRGGV